MESKKKRVGLGAAVCRVGELGLSGRVVVRWGGHNVVKASEVLEVSCL